MSIFLEKMQKDVKALRDYNEKPSWLKRLFFPGPLSKALIELKNEDPYDLLYVYQQFFSNTWFFQRWFFSSLRLFSASLATQILRDAYQI
jgi:hypothetical protein